MSDMKTRIDEFGDHVAYLECAPNFFRAIAKTEQEARDLLTETLPTLTNYYVNKYASDLCIPLPTLPDEMEDGYVVMEWGRYRISILIDGKVACYQLEQQRDDGVWVDRGFIPAEYKLLLQLPPLPTPNKSDWRVQGNKVRRKG